MATQKNIHIIGGGIIGLSCAYFLQKSGHQVTVIDQSKMEGGASYVNAGYLSPSHFIPLAAPGVVKQGIRWMFNPKSPLYIKPRLNPDFLKWSLAFNASCTERHVSRATPVLKSFALLGRDLFQQIKTEENWSFQLEKKGLLMLCNTQEGLDHEHHLVDLAQKEDLKARMLSAQATQAMMPETTVDILGASYFECDHHTTPETFMSELKAHLKNVGVVFRQEEQVLDLEIDQNRISQIITSKERLKADICILAAGSWTRTLSRKLQLKLLLEAGKGYRIQTTRNTGITYPAILSEAKVAITPMAGFTRFAGTMEIAGINHTINTPRVDAIAESVHRYFPEITLSDDEKAQAACGLRPVTPDGLPYIGKSAKCDNLIIATGHAMMGWTLGPSTGKLVQEIVDEVQTSLPLEPFHPDRSFRG